MKNVHIVVKGHVQGIGFRYYVLKHANLLGLDGVVRNLINGDVEIYASGENNIISDFIDIVKKGPALSRVDNVDVCAVSGDLKYSGFEVRH